MLSFAALAVSVPTKPDPGRRFPFAQAPTAGVAGPGGGCPPFHNSCILLSPLVFRVVQGPGAQAASRQAAGVLLQFFVASIPSLIQ